MSDPPVSTRPSSRGGGFSKGLKTALERLPHPRIAVVARTRPRADFIRELCVGVTNDPAAVAAYVEGAAAEALQLGEHNLVVLDCSMDDLSRSALKLLAKEQVAGCAVMEIRKWSVPPPE